MKVHLLRNKHREVKVTTACGTTHYNDSGARNSRSTFQKIPEEFVVDIEAFKATAPEDRCALCCEAGLIIRNRQRREKGLPPAANLFE